MAKLTGLSAKVMVEQYKKVFSQKGYAFFENGDYNLNIVGVRNDSGDASKFDDFLNVLYKVDGEWVCDVYPATTEPGTSILKRPIKAVRHKGTAILVPDQYRSTYRIGTHGGKRSYTALVQRGGKVRVARDNNRDSKPDYHNPEEEGWFGINIHKHWGSDARVNTGGVSAGCQVFQSSKDFYEFMDTCQQSADTWGNSFTYTLIEEKDLLDKGVS
tara:strand:- start:1433 stop:2077 length:645 start_codon:yes stop_codon:yes gene_type:complete